MRYARVAAGIVAEIITLAENGPPIWELYHPDIVAACIVVPEDSGVAEQWTWDGWDFKPPEAEPLPPSVPPSISRRQLLLALRTAELITDAEALAAATVGAVPEQIDAIFARLPAAEALIARVTWATMGTAERTHPLIEMMITAELATAAEVDAIFVTGAAFP